MTLAIFSVIHSAVLHSVIAVMALYLFSVFLWWWIKQGRATVIYALTCFLMFGIFAINSGAAFLYFQKWFHGDFDLLEFVPFWWSFRNYFMVIPLFMFSWHVTKKIRIDYQLRQLAIEDLMVGRIAVLSANETVLVIDDNIDSLIAIKMMLDRTRFKTVEARNATEALALFDRLHSGIVCIILDLVLPELSGWDVLHEIRKKSMKVPVVISSGYVKSPFGKEEVRNEYCAFLSKPYSAAKLIDTIERCIKGDTYDS